MSSVTGAQHTHGPPEPAGWAEPSYVSIVSLLSTIGFFLSGLQSHTE